MNPPTTVSPPQSVQPVLDTRDAVRQLCEQFRDTRHDLNNVFSVLLGLAELGTRNPANLERLGEAVLERCPKVLEDLQRFQEALFGLKDRLNTTHDSHKS
jgi:hypothetical protein